LICGASLAASREEGLKTLCFFYESPCFCGFAGAVATFVQTRVRGPAQMARTR
jgi:hypothetical protein